MKFIVLLVVAAFVCSSCQVKEDAESRHPFSDTLVAAVVSEATEVGGSVQSRVLTTICQNAAWSTAGAGIFTVRDLIGVGEVSPVDGEVQGFTYVVLAVEEAWHGEFGDEVVVRLPGGPISDSEFTGTFLPLELGQRVAMLLRGDTDDWNEGFFSANTAGTYYDTGGPEAEWVGLGGHSYTTVELREAVASAYRSFEPGEFTTASCGVVVDFERCPPESLVPVGAARFDQPCLEDHDREERPVDGEDTPQEFNPVIE
jgi:hypothetical protein